MLRIRSMAAMALVSVVTLGSGVATRATGDEPPGHDGRVTHQTLLETTEMDCYEIAITRAGSTAIDAHVPDRYTLLRLTNGAPRLVINDYACAEVSVDGQRLNKATIVTLGRAVITARDGTPAAGSYLLWLATDNPGLAARYRQVGVPASYVPMSSWSTTTSTSGLVSTTIEVVDADLGHTLESSAPVAPVPVPVDPPNGPIVFYEGSKGSVRMTIVNTELGSAGARVWGDLSVVPAIAPLVNPQFATMVGTNFPAGAVRGSWTSTVERID